VAEVVVVLPSVPMPREVPREALAVLDKVQGKTLRIFVADGMSNADMVRLMGASQPFTLQSGDQSLSEAISAGKTIYYEVATHKQLLIQDVCILSEAIEPRKARVRAIPPGAPFSEALAENMLVYQEGLAGWAAVNAQDESGVDLPRLQAGAQRGAIEQILSTARLPDTKTHIVVHVKDLGGFGDIMCAAKTVHMLRARFGKPNVTLLLGGETCLERFLKSQVFPVRSASSPHPTFAKKMVLKISAGDMADAGVAVAYLMDRGEPFDARRTIGPLFSGGNRLMVVEVPSPSAGDVYNVFKDWVPRSKFEAVLLGQSSETAMIQLREYAYSQYNAATRTKRSGVQGESVGLGPLESGIVVHPQLRLWGLGERTVIDGLNDLGRCDNKALVRALSVKMSSAAQHAAERPIYFGYGYQYAKCRYHFVRTVAHLECELDRDVDVVLVGKGGFDIATILADVAGLGIGLIEVHRVTEQDVVGQDKQPCKAVPRARLPDVRGDAPTIRAFQAVLSPNTSVFAATAEGRAIAPADAPIARDVYAKMAAWVRDGRLTQQFVRLGHLACSVCDFDARLAGRIHLRQMLAAPESPSRRTLVESLDTLRAAFPTSAADLCEAQFELQEFIEEDFWT
jgi:hypothetical protein